VDYFSLLEETCVKLKNKDQQDSGIKTMAKRYGVVSVPLYWLEQTDIKVYFHPCLGLWEDKDLQQLFSA